MSRVALRPLALPQEHGAWAFLLEPIAVGMLVAPSRMGGCIAFGAVMAFLARHPLLLALRDRGRGRRNPRTAICERFAVAYAAFAAVAFAQVGLKPMLPLLAALPLAVIHFKSGGRTLAGELAGALAPAATAAAIVIAGGSSTFTASALWLLLGARAIVSILYVRSALRGESRALMLTAHAVAVVIAVVLAFVHVVSFGAIAAMLMLLARALPKQLLSARSIGVRELGYGALTVLLIVI
jgi:hypothetical protein